MTLSSLRPYGFALVAFAGLTSLTAGATDFKSQVLPLLQKKCADCHTAAKKVKGKFDIAVEANYADNVKAGSPEASKLFTSVTAPDDDDDVMPPSKNRKTDRLTPPEVALIKAWITEGASFAAGGAKPGAGAAPAAAAPAAAAGGAMDWKNAAGKTLKAEFDRIEGDNVVLKAADGKYYSVPMASLSPESQAQAKKAAGQ